MNPNIVFRRREASHGFREFAIHALIAWPIGGIKVAQQNEVMKQEPEDLIGKSPIESINVVLGEPNGVKCIS
jgi:hypothetical protein